MVKLYLKNLISFKDISLKKLKNILSSSFGPEGGPTLFYKNNKELKILNKGGEILEALTNGKGNEKNAIKILEYLAQRNLKNSGEGSISICLFFSHLLHYAFLFITNGHNGITLSKGLQKLSLFISSYIFEKSIPVREKKDIENILKSSLSYKVDKKLSCFLQESFQKIKREGLLQIEENFSKEYFSEEVKGIEIEKGFASSYFINDSKNFEICYENALLLISTSPLTHLSQIKSILSFSKREKLPLVIITHSISKELLSTLALNYVQRKLKVVVIKYSSIGVLKTGVLDDLSLLTNSMNYESNTLKGNIVERNYEISDLGLIEKVIVKKNKSIFFLPKFSKLLVERRINELNRELLLAENAYEKSLYENRIARLSGNLLKLSINNEPLNRIEETKKRIEYLVLTFRASLEEGYLIGGASFYLLLYKELKHWSEMNLVGDEIYASHIIIQSLKELSLDLFAKSKAGKFNIFQNLLIMSYPYTYHIRTNSVFGKKIKASEYGNGNLFGLYDCSKSTRLLFTNSLSMLSSLISLD